HVFSFFLICLWILIVERWWEDCGWRRSAALGVVAALIVLVRHTNVIYLLVLPLHGVARWEQLRSRLAEMWGRWKVLSVAMLAGAATASPQLVLYKTITGGWLVSPYGALNGGFTFASPHLSGVLFSTQKGLFFWSPLLMLSAAGALVARGWARGM